MIGLAKARFEFAFCSRFRFCCPSLLDGPVSPLDDAAVLLAERNRSQIWILKNLFQMTLSYANRAFEADMNGWFIIRGSQTSR